MKTHVLVRVRKHFNSDLVPASTNRHNQLAWCRAVRMLGDKWLLANPRIRQHLEAQRA
jgi:hypothetical protein